MARVRSIFIFCFFLINFLGNTFGYAQQNYIEPEVPAFTFKPVRQPKYPLKTKSMIYSASDIQTALDNIQHYDKALAIKKNILKDADIWLNWNDADIRFIMSDARVPRGFDLNPLGCPVHGDTIFKKEGTYPWIIDPHIPFKVKCPVGGEIYPSNDYAAYYKSGFTDKKDWKGNYTDNGWGWVAPNGERYWFVAYANHWIWKSHIEPAIVNLGRAYLLTGDKRYAHKVAVMLGRLAEIYPSMDHAHQSRYGYILKQQGRLYNGKIFNLIWETSFIQGAAEAYDATWNTIDSDSILQNDHGKSGKDLRAFIEANVLEDALDGYLEFKIQGNYGMHQSALLYVLLARQFMDTDKYIHMIVDEPGVSRVQTGIRYALYNMIFRDGTPLESPHYNILTVDKLATLGALLKRTGNNIFTDLRMRLLFESPMEMVVTKKYTPDIGDSGNTLGGISGLNSNAYQIGYESYTLPEILNWLQFMHKTGDNSFDSYESLFRTVITDSVVEKAGISLPPRQSRLFAGYGMGILNNHKDNTGIAVNYGYKGTHYHWDFLNVELFANGQKMMPDLGYPDAMNEFVKEVYTWSTNTISHNTVVVDAQRQDINKNGVLHHFSNGNFARSIDASARPYKQVSEYRRNIIMVDADSNSSYFVDFFRVQGGKQHDYALHGPPGKEHSISGEWGEIQAGTFAGADVEVGKIYDDEHLGVKGYQGSYGGYKGSGYQHLFNVQPFKKGALVTEYQHIKDSSARLRIHIPQSKQYKIFKAAAFNKPRAKEYVIKYLLVRHEAVALDTSLKTVFTSIWEPYNNKPVIINSADVIVKGGASKATQVRRKGYYDIVISDTGNAIKSVPSFNIQTDASTAVVTLSTDNKLKRVYFTNGTFLKWQGKEYKASFIRGEIEDIDVNERSILIKAEALSNVDVLSVSKKNLHISNPYKNTVHPVASAKIKNGLLEVKTTDDILIGKLKVDSVDAQYIYTSTTLPFAELYKGATLLNEQKKPVALITDVLQKGTKLQVLRNADNVGIGNDLWICNIAVGEFVEIKPVFEKNEN